MALAAPAPALAARRKPAVRPRVVVIDPGHGGVDPGCIGVDGTYEKNITLATARELAHELQATKRYRVHLTRDDDEFVALHDRVRRARALKADLFISIHADSLPDSHLRGATVFTLSEKASDREAAAVAARENKADLIGGIDLSSHPPEVSDILFDLARRQTNNLSIRLAHDLVTELGRRVAMLHDKHRSAGFAVLKAPDIPSALVEIGCLSNRQEERALNRPPYRRKVATGVTRSVNDYFDFIAKA
jgi:N-acetylmuramoyl-L-alanine amidase